MHKIYIDEGTFNIIYQIPQIIYSSLISAIITIFIKYLSLSEKEIIKMKQEKKKELLDSIVKDLKKRLKIKFILFFIFSFVFITIFAFYIICFCGIYENTQTHLVKNTFISYGLSLIYPFGIYLIPGIFRFPALKAKNKDKECLYNLSKLLQKL